MKNETCPCCSGKSLAECCGPLLDGSRAASTAEELLRSRYSAFALVNIDYVRATRHPRSSSKFDEETVREWAEGSRWNGLEIRETEGGGPKDETGTIDFTATYTEKETGTKRRHDEHALFVKHEGAWRFVDGDYVRPETFVRTAPKVGRNDPCPCGSGRKHKKCCGAQND